jgi:hypothetical protein
MKSCSVMAVTAQPNAAPDLGDKVQDVQGNHVASRKSPQIAPHPAHHTSFCLIFPFLSAPNVRLHSIQ